MRIRNLPHAFAWVRELPHVLEGPWCFVARLARAAALSVLEQADPSVVATGDEETVIELQASDRTVVRNKALHINRRF